MMPSHLCRRVVKGCEPSPQPKALTLEGPSSCWEDGCLELQHRVSELTSMTILGCHVHSTYGGQVRLLPQTCMHMSRATVEDFGHAGTRVSPSRRE